MNRGGAVRRRQATSGGRRAPLPSPDTPGYRRCSPASAPALLPSNSRDGMNETMATPPQDPYADPIFGYPPQPGPEPEAPKPQKHRRWPWVVGIVAALLIGISIGASGEDPPPAQAADNSDELANLQVSLEATQEQLETVGDQRDAALAELDAAEEARDTAREKLAEAEEDRDAAIARAEDAEGQLEDAQGELAAAEAAAAEEEAQAEAAGTQFGDGTWVVGEDIEPGVYRNDGGGWCYWERLSGLSGEFGDIIANGVPEGQAAVEISGSDGAFSSDGRRTWPQQ